MFLIPGFLVPVFVLTHLAVFVRLARREPHGAAQLMRRLDAPDAKTPKRRSVSAPPSHLDWRSLVGG